MADGKVVIEIDADASEFEKKLSAIETTMVSTGNRISGVGSSLTTGITVPVTAAATAAIKLGSDYEENLNKVDASFKQNAGEVERWAKSATTNFGLSESKALEATSQFGDMGTSMGLSTAAAAEMSTGLAGLAGDLSSFKNIDIDQAMTALNGVFTGETESLKTLGVVMTETNLKQFASDCGLVYDGMSQAEKVTLRYKYVLAMTKNAQGDYKATSDGTANSLRTLQSSASNLGASFGQKLLPKITPIIQETTNLVDKFGDLDDSTQNAIIKAALVAAAVGPVTTAVGKTTSGIGNLLTVSGKAVSAFGRFSSGLAGTGAAATEAAAGVSTATTATGGLGSALTAALGTGGAAALAVAGTAAVTAGAIALGTAIHNATDPTIQLKKHLEEFSTAQDNVGKADNIIDLANRYEELRSKLQDTTLSATEIADAQAQLDGIRQSLNEATNGAITLEGDYNNTLDDTVAHQKELAEIEKQRSTAEIYSSLVSGAKDYKNALEEQGTVQDQLEKAKARLTTAENDLQSAMATVTSGTEKNRLATMRDNMALDNAVLSADGARDSYNKLQDQMTELQGITSAYENEVIGLVQDGFLSAEDGASLLGISVEQLGRKMTTYWNNAHKAETATSALADEHLDAAEAAKEQQSAEEEATKSLASVGAEAYNAINAGGDLRESYEELSKEAEKYTENADEQIAADTELALQRLNLAATNQELITSYAGYVSAADAAGVSVSNLSAWLIENGLTAEEWGSKVDTATDGVINSFGKVDTSLDMSLSQMAANLQSNITAYANWNNNISTLMQAAVASGDQAAVDFVNYMANMGIGAAAQVQAMVDNIDYTMDTFPPLMAEAAQEGMTSVYTSVENGKVTVAGAATGVMDAAATSIGTADLGGAASVAAATVPAGISGQAAAAAAAGQELGMAAHTAIANISWTDLGSAIGQGLANGITGQTAAIQTAAQQLATDVTSVWTGQAGAFQQAGTNAGSKIQSGLSGELGSIRSAGQRLADSVTSVWASKSGAFQQSGSTAGMRIQAGLVAQQAPIRNAGQRAADAVVSVWASKSGAFQQAGSNAGAKLSTGLASRSDAIRNSAQTLTTIVLTVWANANGQFQSAGASASSAVAQGISGGRGIVSNAASSVANAAYYAMQIDGWYNLGYNISAGVASGVRGGSYLITAAARTAAQNALAAAKRSLGVNSPSRVFRDQVGKMIPAGMALGIQQATPKATAAVELTSEQLLRATRAALRPSGTMQETNYVNNTISNYSYSANRGNTVVLKAPVYLDGREIARASAKYTGRQMAYLEGL